MQRDTVKNLSHWNGYKKFLISLFLFPFQVSAPGLNESLVYEATQFFIYAELVDKIYMWLSVCNCLSYLLFIALKVFSSITPVVGTFNVF